MPLPKLGYDTEDLDPASLRADLRLIVEATSDPALPPEQTYILDRPDIQPGDQRAYDSTSLLTKEQFELLDKFSWSLGDARLPGSFESDKPDYDPELAHAANVLLDMAYGHDEPDLRPSELDRIAGSVYYPQC